LRILFNILPQLDEDGFLNLIKTRRAPREQDLDEKTRKKLKQEREAMESAAREMEKREKKMEKENAQRGSVSFLSTASCSDFGPSDTKAVPVNSQLWTTRYAPQSLKEICGNKGQVEKLQQWLNDWLVYSYFH
jgi:replication factor C subunit 1